MWGQMQGEDKRAKKVCLYLRQKENLELNEVKQQNSDSLHPTIWKLQVQGFLINLSIFYECNCMHGQ